MSVDSTRTMDLKTWYGSSIKVPTYYDRNFNSFVASSIGIVRSIVQDKIGKRIQVNFMAGGTAHADADNAVISINEEYLEGMVEPGQKYPLPSDTAITLLLGLIVHEAAHFAYSPATLRPYRDYIQAHTTCVFHSQVAAILGNVIEDIYIEAEVDRQVPSLSWMVGCTNRVFFSYRNQIEALDKVRGIEYAPADLDGIGNVMSLLIYAKTRGTVSDVSLYVADLFHQVRSATELVAVDDRYALALQVYEQLMVNYTGKGEAGECKGKSSKNSDKSGQSGLGEEEGKGESDEGDSSADRSDQKSASVDNAERSVKGYAAEHGESEEESDKGKKKFGPTSPKDMKAIWVQKHLEKLEGSDVKLTVAESDGLIERPTTLFIETPLRRDKPIALDARYAGLAEIGRQRAVVNRPYGMDTNRGTHIRKLHRIATDQKIFAQPVAMNNYKPMQVIILVDCSGSMMHMDYELKETRLMLALKAALGAAVGLSEARCEVAVYGHTAETLGGSEVVIYEAKKFNETVDGLDARLGQLFYNEMTLQNRDGYAIAHVGRKFTDRRKRRVLIVISDGEPAAGHYSGGEAIQHTKNAVETVRQNGVDVLSISITREANRANEIIYGSRFNVFNNDPGVIEAITRSLVLE